MQSKKLYTLITIAIAIIAAGAIMISVFVSADTVAGELEALTKNRPQLAEFTVKIQGLLKQEAPTDEVGLMTYYLDLGLAWKSLADRTNEADHYLKALNVYQQGIELTEGRNLVFINNAGNMALFAKDYGRAKQFFEQSIEFAPGDAEAYVNLADVHRYYLGSDFSVILEIYDRGIARMINPTVLEQRRERYLESLEE